MKRSLIFLIVLAMSAPAISAPPTINEIQARTGLPTQGTSWKNGDLETIPAHFQARMPVRTKSTSGTQAKPFWEEYEKSIQNSQSIGTLGPDLFGDRVDLDSGGLSFSVNDVSLKGNNALPVAFTRIHSSENRKGYFAFESPLGDWDLDIPNISGVYSEGLWRDKRCSYDPTSTITALNDVVPPSIWGSTTYSGDFLQGLTSYTFTPAGQYWHGLHASMPGGGELLFTNSSITKPVQGGPYAWTTNGNTHLSCLTSVKNGTGEGFVAITADGTKYWFDWLAAKIEPLMSNGEGKYYLRVKYSLYATRVVDKHGNWVNYTYTNARNYPVKLTEINSSDGRQLKVAYQNNGQLDYVSTLTGSDATSGNRVWRYEYSNLSSNFPSLKKVTLPDNTTWEINFNSDFGLSRAFINYSTYTDTSKASRECGNPGYFPSDFTFTGSIKHPSGAVGDFTVKRQRRGLSNVIKNCQVNTRFEPSKPDWVNYKNYEHSINTLKYDVLALTQKKITGPGLEPRTWNYSYESTNVAFLPSGSGVCESDTCAGKNITTVTNDDGSWQRFSFGNSFLYNEGKLVATETGRGTTTQASTASSYEFSKSGQPFPTPYALSPQRGFLSRYTTEYLRPQKGTTITQDGVTFENKVERFDEFANPTIVTKSSSLGYSTSDVIAYENNYEKWVLGQVKSVTNIETSREVSRSEFDPVTTLPTAIYNFGQLQSRFGYNIDGTIATIKDGNNFTTTLSNFKRGVPQRIDYPDSSFETAVVNDFGWITSNTDERGSTFNYEYDLLGRLTKLSPPSGDVTAWNITTQSFSQLTAVTYGLPIGAWKQTISKGNYRKETYLDSMWRPVVIREYDFANIAGTQRFTRIAYDSSGRVAFKSYPGKADLITQGTHTKYDDLGRVTQIKQNSEIGDLITTNEYLPGFKIKTTNPKQASTTASFMAWDVPDTSLPMRIESPEDVLTTFTRDTFGKPLTVTRTGLTNGILSNTRTYEYDFHQRLCQKTEPESGGTMYSYDEVGNLLYTAKGTAGCTKILPLTRTDHTYDPLNRIKTVDFPNSTNDLTYNYLPGGLLQNVSNGGVVWSFDYNKLGLPNTETLSLEGRTRTIAHRYDANGVEDRLTYPNGLVVDYSPNALGQATQAARPSATAAIDKFATGATYRSNGSNAGFTYGNGVIHTEQPNLRGLPALRSDIFNNAPIFSETAAFDANGNVLCVSDGTSGSGADREMSYDGLDRLTNTTMPNSWWINTTTNYDVLDNIIKHTVGNRQHTYVYDANQRLGKITRPFGSSGSLSTAKQNVAAKTLATCISYPLSADIGVDSAASGSGGTPDPDPEPDPNDPGGPGGPGSGQQSITFTDKAAPGRLSDISARFSAWLAKGKSAKRPARTFPGVKADTPCCQTPEQPITVYQFAYDSNGNTVAGRHNAVFDAANRLVEITGKEKYTYDGFGRRVKTERVSDGKTNYSIYSLSGKLVAEEDARSNKKTDYVYLNGNLVAQRSATLTGSTYTNTYLHTDSLGSPVVHTNQMGAPTKIERYTPYGEPSDHSYDQGPGYTGHVTDSLTGLTYAQQRYYDPMIGRFLSVDPVETNPNNGTSFNRYWYANNNPYSNIDPDGRMCMSANGITRCSPEDATFKSFSIPTPEGWSDFHSKDPNFHDYRFEYDAGTGNAAYGEALKRELVLSPTNDFNPASKGGTLNNVGPLLEFMSIPLSGKDHVKSYTTSNGIVNVTQKDHLVGSGFVARTVVGKKDPRTGLTRYTIVTYGEGDSWKQLMPTADQQAKDFWDANGKLIEDRARQSK